MLNKESKKVILKPGIKIGFSDDISSANRLSINDGVVEIEPDLYPQYSHPAFIPKLPWRSLTETEKDMIVITHDSDSVNPSETITVTKIPELMINPIRNLIEWGESTHGKTVSAEHIKDHQSYPQIRDEISKYIHRNYAADVDSEIDCRQAIKCDIDLPTTTINEIEFLPAKLFAGMHLDSWDYLPFRLRHRSRNRICINLGQEVRFFLIINRTTRQMFDDLHLIDPDDIYKDYRGVRLSNKFLKNLSDYPVIKLGIYPGEAYIAPTENFIHDATSLDKKMSDWSITFLGDFTSFQIKN
jgi:predicted Zn-dependent protease with MMP-like domain